MQLPKYLAEETLFSGEEYFCTRTSWNMQGLSRAAAQSVERGSRPPGLWASTGDWCTRYIMSLDALEQRLLKKSEPEAESGTTALPMND